VISDGGRGRGSSGLSYDVAWGKAGPALPQRHRRDARRDSITSQTLRALQLQPRRRSPTSGGAGVGISTGRVYRPPPGRAHDEAGRPRRAPTRWNGQAWKPLQLCGSTIRLASTDPQRLLLPSGLAECSTRFGSFFTNPSPLHAVQTLAAAGADPRKYHEESGGEYDLSRIVWVRTFRRPWWRAAHLRPEVVAGIYEGGATLGEALRRG